MNDYENAPKQKTPYYQTVKFWLSMAALLFGLVIIISSFEIVQTGEKGVVLRWGEFNREMGPGLNWKIPISDQVTPVNVKTQIIKSSEKAASNDMQDAFTEVAVNFNILDKNVKAVFIDVRNKYAETYIIPYVQEAVKAVTAEYTAEELITKRSAVKADITENLKLALAKVNINVTNISITDFNFSPEFNKAIEEKVTAEQEALKQVNITLQEEEKKKQEILKAQAMAEKTRLEAQALLMNSDLIDKIIAEAQLKAAEKWNGVLPTHMYGSAPIPLLNLTN